MQQVVLIICDGWGYREDPKDNAIAAAKKPNYDSLWKNYPHAILKASGEDIGLPDKQMGTSEANHLIIGSGRILYQNLLRINHAVTDGSLEKNQVLQQVFSHVIKNKSALHLIGMISPGGVHNHSGHLKAIVKYAKTAGVNKIYFHLLTDGRDTLPKSALGYLKDFDSFLKQEKIGWIASIGGRYFGMDRDNNLDRTKKHFETIVKGEGERLKNSTDLIDSSYQNNLTDEFIVPALIEDENNQIHTVQPNDAVVFTNFRSDRAKQLTKMFLQENIPGLFFVTMTKYANDIDCPVIFSPLSTKNTLSEVLSRNNIKQLRVTETEKFTHLTFFFNAQRYEPDPGEDRIMIPSNRDIKTHDQKPEMKALEIADKVVEAIQNKSHDFICCNLVNADMVGHSGNFLAIVKAIETVDQAFGKIIEAAKKTGATVMITADHGNAEETIDEVTGMPKTSHTLNPVPFVLISQEYKTLTKKEGSLSDIAPTILKLFNLPIPSEMTGQSLI